MNPAHNPNLHPLSSIPSGMDNDPNADEQIIDQTSPRPSAEENDLSPPTDKTTGLIPSQQTDDPASDDRLSEKIAYALAGAEPPTIDESPRKVTHEGMTGASLEDEADRFRD